MKATDKGLHDPVRTEAEARAEKALHSMRDWLPFTSGEHLGLDKAEVDAVLDHIDAQAETIAQLEASNAHLETDLIGSVKDLEDMPVQSLFER